MANVTILGRAHTSFKGKDGTLIEGDTIYTMEGIDPRRGEGHRADHFFLSASKLAALDFTLKPGQEVEIYYNRFGKVQTIRLVDDVVVV